MPAPELNSSLQPASVVPPRADALEDKDNHVVQTVENNPVFGHGMLKYWDFQPGYVNLNSGASTPSTAQAAYQPSRLTLNA